MPPNCSCQDWNIWWIQIQWVMLVWPRGCTRHRITPSSLECTLSVLQGTLLSGCSPYLTVASSQSHLLTLFISLQCGVGSGLNSISSPDLTRELQTWISTGYSTLAYGCLSDGSHLEGPKPKSWSICLTVEVSWLALSQEGLRETVVVRSYILRQCSDNRGNRITRLLSGAVLE